MSYPVKKIRQIEQRLSQLRIEWDGPLRSSKAFAEWTTLNTHLTYIKKVAEIDGEIERLKKQMAATLDSVMDGEDKTAAYEKWSTMNTQMNELEARKVDMEEEAIESKAIDAILNAEQKLL